jgi:L-fuconolactonase
MRIDSHQHFWYYNPQRESWITDEMSNIRKDFLPEDLGPVLERNNIDGCIAVQANESEEESQFLLDLASQNSFVKGVVGWVDLAADNCEERLAYFSKNPLFKGIRHTLQNEDSHTNFKRGISCLRKFDFSCELLVREHQLPEVIALVKEYPAQRFLLDHMGKPQISQGLSNKWIENIQQLGACNNVSCKVSGFLSETESFEWDVNDFMPFFDAMAGAFGENRIMFGSDWPVCLAAGTYEDTVKIVERFFVNRGNSVLDKVMSTNAVIFYNL